MKKILIPFLPAIFLLVTSTVHAQSVSIGQVVKIPGGISIDIMNPDDPIIHCGRVFYFGEECKTVFGGFGKAIVIDKDRILVEYESSKPTIILYSQQYSRGDYRKKYHTRDERTREIKCRSECPSGVLFFLSVKEYINFVDREREEREEFERKKIAVEAQRAEKEKIAAERKARSEKDKEFVRKLLKEWKK